MSDFPLNEKKDEITENAELDDAIKVNGQDTDDEFSTIFGDPVEHRKKAGDAHKKKRLLSVIAACLAVVVLVGGTLAVIKLIPEKETEDSADYTDETIQVLELEEDAVSAVTMTNSKGSFKLVPVRTETETDTDSEDSTDAAVTTTWTVEGTDQKYTSSSAIQDKVSSVISLTAISEITGKTAEQCGFNDPLYTAVIELADAENRTVEVGTASGDGLGNYLRVSGDDKIYLVEASALAELEFELLDLADTTAIPGITVTDDMADYTGDDGALTTFDTITLTGSNFAKPLVISAKNDDSAISQYFNYTITSPQKRIADNVDDLFNMFTNGLSVSGAYAFDVSAASLKAVGLDAPYLTASVKIGNTTATFKIAKVDDEYCAVVTDDSYMIRKVAASNLTFLDYDAESFYSNMVFLENIMDLSELTLTAGEDSYTFGIAYDEEAESDSQFTITHNGEQITAGFFQNFYQDFVGMTFADYNTDSAVTAMDMTITVKFLDGHTESVALAKDTATKYACFVNGERMGRVSSTDYNRLLKDIRNVSQNKDIP